MRRLGRVDLDVAQDVKTNAVLIRVESIFLRGKVRRQGGQWSCGRNRNGRNQLLLPQITHPSGLATPFTLTIRDITELT